MQKKKIWIGLVTGLLTVALALFVVLVWFSHFTLTLSVEDDASYTVEYGTDEREPEAIAVVQGELLLKDGMQVKCAKEGEADPESLGEYPITVSSRFLWLHSQASYTVSVVDTTPPEITLVSDPEHFTSPIASYEEEGYSAYDFYDGDVTDQVESEEAEGFVTYTVTDSNGNTATVLREIIYKDVVPPEITLAGESEMTWEAGKEFEEPGYTASDDCDGDITDRVTIAGEVDTAKLGSYELTYEVRDSYDNPGTAVRTVTVTDTTAPVIKLSGDSSVYVQKGKAFSDPGYTATDNLDGDLTGQVKISGSPDTSKTGVYTVSYTVSDQAGNSASASRTVYVYAKQASSAASNPGNKVVYLTFDDGPYKYTSQLLDVLDQYGVKATFFVTNQYPSYQYMIAEESKRGHTVAIHSYSHDYAKIYASEEAFYDDLQKMEDIIVKQTGKTPTIIRFPGGSSNAVSKKYCSGIMTSLTQSIGKMGYLYSDWNVLSGDAGETTDTDTVASNVIAGIQKHNVSIVLQHDIKGFSVDAVEAILQWGLANGYTFLPMTDSTPMVHQSLNN